MARHERNGDEKKHTALGGEKHLHAKGDISACLVSLLFSFFAFDDPHMMRKHIALRLAFLQNEIHLILVSISCT